MSGTDGDGWITIIAGLIAGWKCWRKRYVGGAISAGVGLALVIWKFADLGTVEESSFISVSPGSGLYVCGFGAGLCAVASLQRWWQLRRG